MNSKSLWIRMATIFILASMTAGCSASFRNQQVKPAAPAAEIGMLDQHGNEFRLSGQRGKVVLLYFGFVNCPEECPLTMAHIKLALGILGDSSKNVQVVMVSTDPVRDTPQALNEFLGKFDASFLAIPGTLAELQKVWSEYDVTVLDGGETHSSFTYVIDKKGDLRLTFVPDAAPEDIASDLQILLAEQ